MACGIGQYELAIMVTLMVLLILVGFAWVQQFIDRYNKEMVYRITITNDLELKSEIEKNIRSYHLKFIWLNYTKVDTDLIIAYEISGAEKNHDMLIHFLTTFEKIKSFNV